MSLHDHQNKLFVITKNKTTMDFAVTCAEKVVHDPEMLKLINHVRLFKKVYLPFELVGGSGRDQTDAFVNEMQKSQIRWTFYSGNVNKHAKKAFKVWK